MKILFPLSVIAIFLIIPKQIQSQEIIHTVIIEKMKFTPEKLTIKLGDSVVWINKDFVPHTITEETKKFDSSTLLPDKSWKLKADKVGSYSYICSFHPTMKGRLLIE